MSDLKNHKAFLGVFFVCNFCYLINNYLRFIIVIFVDRLIINYKNCKPFNLLSLKTL